MLNNWSDLCLPVKVYLIIQVLGIFGLLLSINKTKQATVERILILVGLVMFMTFLWAWFIQLVCGKGYKAWSWFLVIGVPLVLFIGNAAILSI